MTPIHELLNRIRWDADFGRGEFVIGYYDRVADSIMRVPLRQVFFDPADHFACQTADAEGESHMLPFHRIRGLQGWGSDLATPPAALKPAATSVINNQPGGLP